MNKENNIKLLKINQGIHKSLTQLLLTTCGDLRLQRMQILRVEVTGDLSLAKVFFSTLEPLTDVEKKAMLHLLKRAAGFLRTGLANQMRLRRVPMLRFMYETNELHLSSVGY
jgi:ribosome-binding factor A